MVATIKDAYVNALLADAAYVSNLDLANTPNKLATALTGRMTPDLAKYIGDNFTVVTQVSNLPSSFDATVWRGNAGMPYAGQVYVSMRGTQEPADFAADADLASSGLAHAELVDMANWWLRETTPANQMAKQVALAALPLPGLPTFVAAPDVQGTGNLTGVGTIKSVNGHSLGGYLAGDSGNLLRGGRRQRQPGRWPNFPPANSLAVATPPTFQSAAECLLTPG